ncbi:MAG: nucleotidyltransferase domain-containing protein [Chloroflexi bacterium]|nr:nucleotidyltransferase domain-containing protein [Chloroflexota bacterium]
MDKIVLFGSYAQGRPNEWSDIDLAVISPDFDGLEMLSRIDLMAQARSSRDSRIEALGYGSRQFEGADRLTFLGEIKRTGKVIYPGPRRRNGHKKSVRSKGSRLKARR